LQRIIYRTIEALTWAYFGHSCGFTCVIGVFQIVGAFLLLFRHTRLFGAVFLFPILLNITLLNIFYGFETGDLLHALILLIGLSYLVLKHYRRLISFFFRPVGSSTVYFSAKKVIPVTAVIVFPLLLVLSFGPPDRNPQLAGKYQVQDLSVNRVRSAAKMDRQLPAGPLHRSPGCIVAISGLGKK
jgi:hypothetical protein